MIEIIREQDELNREVWDFWPDFRIHKVDIILDSYSVQSRPTKRHGWKTTEKYDRSSRKGWGQGHRPISLDEVPVIPGDVVEEVIARFMATVTVKRGR